MSTVDDWLSAGLKRERILLQIPAFATSQTFTPDNETRIGMQTKSREILTQAQVGRVACGCFIPMPAKHNHKNYYVRWIKVEWIWFKRKGPSFSDSKEKKSDA